MKFSTLALTAVTYLNSASGEFFLKENFNDDAWTSRWTESSTWKPKAEMGTWKHTAGEWYGDSDNKGIQTSEDARFYGLSAKLDVPFVSGSEKPLVIQYSVKHEQNLDCGGAYIKLLPGGDKFDATAFGGDTPYAVMFGPDVCGTSNKKTHVILHDHKKDENLLVKKEVSTETDDLTHLYTLLIKPDNTFQVFIDNKSVREGSLDEHFDFLVAKTIKDPDAKKPDDWVDNAKMVDPEDKKPDDWDEQPEEIADPDAKKPEDWDDEDDGEWEAPMIDNPDYNGEWKAKMIDNPDYKGKWEHPMIDNPEYSYNEEMYKVCKDGCTHVGFEIWQVKTGTLFDDIIVTDSLEEAEEYAKETFFKMKDGEKKMYDEHNEKKRAEEEANSDEEDEDEFDGMGMDDMDMEGMMGDEF
jgi:calreticulin